MKTQQTTFSAILSTLRTSTWNSRIKRVLMLALLAISAYAQVIIPPNPADTQAVAAGQITSANAIWWGFDSTNVTSNLQAALYSGATKLRIPNVGRPWIVDPLFLSSNKEITLDSGVVLLARKGSFMGNYDCLLNVFEVHDVSIIGYGAEVRMNQADYTASPYTKAEWRNCLNIINCSNINVFGLKLVKSGGDGIGIDGNEPKGNHHCSNIHIKDCVCDSNYRNNISVITAQNLLIENTVLSNANGVAPLGGIDFEPDWENDTLINCTLKNCKIFGNYIGIYVSIGLFTQLSPPISITIDSCYVYDNWDYGNATIDVWGVSSPVSYTGHLVLRNNRFIGTQYYYRLNGIQVDSTMAYIALPVQVTSFTGAIKGNAVSLNWKTATEVNSNTFEIERRMTTTWESIGKLPAGGTSNAPREYVYVDNLKNANRGSIFYRLKSVDNDGSYQYSGEVEVVVTATMPTTYSLEQNYPNPFNPTTTISYQLQNTGMVNLKVYDMLGREVATLVDGEKEAGKYSETFDGSKLSSGTYIYRLQTSSFTETKKLVLLK